MARPSRDGDLRVHGMGLMPRFALSMTVALLLVMSGAGFLLYRSASTIAGRILEETLSEALLLERDEPPIEQASERARKLQSGVEVIEVRYGEPGEERSGHVYQVRDAERNIVERLIVPGSVESLGQALFGLILGIMFTVVIAGAGVAMWVASRVAGPIHDIVDDIRQIAKGHLDHRTRARGGGEIELLARSVDRMAHELKSGQETELELSVREREMEFAAGVREALLPVATPIVAGFDVGSAHMNSEKLSGDFHEFVEREDGKLGLLVCDVSGTGVPAALIGATARSYLRKELGAGGDLAEAMRRVNRDLARDVRRGMFVTALYALLDPPAARLSVVCAGHKVPLLLWRRSDGKLRAVHPDGIALGFDKGPVFDKRLEVQELELGPGDRVLLANSGPLRVTNAEGRELGEKGFYSIVLKLAREDTTRFLRGVRQALDGFAGSDRLPVDVSLVTVAHEDGHANP